MKILINKLAIAFLVVCSIVIIQTLLVYAFIWAKYGTLDQNRINEQIELENLIAINE